MGKNKRKLKAFDGDAESKSPKLANSALKIKEPAKLKDIHKKLNSTHEGEVLPALLDLSSLSSENASVAAIIGYQGGEENGVLVRLLLSFLSHQSSAVQLAAIGSLRNLSACGKEDIVAKLLNLNVLEAVCCLLTSFTATTPDHCNVMEQTCHLLSNLCEQIQDINAAIDCESILPILIKYGLQTETYPMTLSFAANSALLCISEENEEAFRLLIKQSANFVSLTEKLEKKIDINSTDPLAAITLHNLLTVIGILMNIEEVTIHSSRLASTLSLFSIPLSKTLNEYLGPFLLTPVEPNGTVEPEKEQTVVEPVPRTIDTLVEKIGTMTDVKGESEVTGHTKESMEGDEELVLELKGSACMEADNHCLTEKNWACLHHLLDSLQLTLQLLTNISFGDDGESDIVEGKQREGVCLEEDMEVNGMEEEWEEVSEDALKSEVLRPLLVKGDFFMKVLRCLQPVDQEKVEQLKGSKYFPHLQSLLEGIQFSSSTALSAIIECQAISELGGIGKLFECWAFLRQLANAGHLSKDTSLTLEGITGTMRTIVDKFEEEHVKEHEDVILRELKLMSDPALCSLPSPVARRNVINIIKSLGLLLLNKDGNALPHETVEALSGATKVLTLTAGTDEVLWVSAECLDAIIDVYKDDRTDRLAFDCKLIDSLETIRPYFNERHKKYKNKLSKEHRAVVVAVKKFLPEFINYKKPRALNCDPDKEHHSKK